MCKTLKWQLLAPVPGRLSLVAFTLIQPLLVNRFLSYLEEPENKNSANYGYGLIFAYGLVYIGMAVGPPFTFPDFPNEQPRFPQAFIGIWYIDRLL